MTHLPVKLLSIKREPDLVSYTAYDLIVIGGGIYGVMMLFEACRRKLRPLLVEQEDFGAGTSFNWLRILHGGFRYLQKLDLPRFFESVAERSWFLRTFPHLADPLPCLMPLYGKGLRRPNVVRLAVLINDVLSAHRNKGVPAKKHIPGGRIISPEKTLELAPGIRNQGLKGGLIWYDAILPESPILIKEILRWCVGQSAAVLNYMVAKRLIVEKGRVNGIEAHDVFLGKRVTFHSPIVVNVAGPWCRQVAEALDRDRPNLFPYSKAWNVLFNRVAFSENALAVAPDKPNARTYFLIPWKGRLMAGTGHASCSSPENNGRPTIQEMDHFISDINNAVPGLRLRKSDVRHVFHGLLPSVRQGSDKLADRAVFIDHGRKGWAKGLYSVSGVKFTTARRVAEKTIRKLFPKSPRSVALDNDIMDEAVRTSIRRSIFCVNGDKPTDNHDAMVNTLKDIVRSESVVHFHDLVFRRTNLWENPDLAINLCADLGRKLQMDSTHLTREMQMVKDFLKGENAIWVPNASL